MVPVGFVLHSVDGGSVATFVVNYLACLPLYVLAEYGMDQVSHYTGEILGGFLYLTVW